ncbi:MAG: hypothetical protein IJP18_09460 [Oscillospiraceae bacterium]|nr:hypothetical protein [Oscillospiraceae bacterium]
MSRNIRIISVVLVLVLIFFLSMIFRYYLNVNTTHIKDEPETNTAKILHEGLYSFKNEKGFYGVKDGQGRIKIDAVWRDIDSISAEKFIVSRYDEQKIRYGIIDINENIVVPFIYSSIVNKSDEYLVGKVDNGKENRGYIILSIDGDVLVDEEWDRCFKKYENRTIRSGENYVQLEKDGNIYKACITSSGDMKMYYLELDKKINDQEITVKINNLGTILTMDNTHSTYNEIVDNAIAYISALFESDAAKMKELSYDTDYRRLQLEKMNLYGAHLVYTSRIMPSVQRGNDGNVEYRCEVKIMYISPENIEWDGTYKNSEHAACFEVIMKKNQDGMLKISSVEAENIDIETISVPDEYRITETVSETPAP